MVQVNSAACDECGTCVSVCPTNALMIVNTLTVDPARCISCGNCVQVCPFAALRIDK